MITQADLKHYFDYDPITGWFTNRFTRGPAKAGARAGSSSGHGYRRICIDGARLYEHQAAWLYVYGEWLDEIDHEDRIGSHNWIANLRPCTRTQNCCNSERETGESGLKGAYLDHRVSRWYSKIQFGGQVEWLGHFDTVEEAHEAFMDAAAKYHGEFALQRQTQPQPFVRRL